MRLDVPRAYQPAQRVAVGFHGRAEGDAEFGGGGRAVDAGPVGRELHRIARQRVIEVPDMLDPVADDAAAAQDRAGKTDSSEAVADESIDQLVEVRPGQGGARGDGRIRSSLDDLPPFGPTETSVGFKIAVQLKSIGSGGQR